MSDNSQTLSVQEVRIKTLAIFRETEIGKKTFALDVAMECGIPLEEARAVIAWLHDSGYITHNNLVHGWDSNDVTELGHHYYMA